VRAHRVVVPPPALDEHLSLLEGVEDRAFQQFITKLGVEALAATVLPRAAWFDVSGCGRQGRNSLAHRFGHELGAVVGPNMPRDAAQDEQVREHVDHISRLPLPVHSDHQALRIMARSSARSGRPAAFKERRRPARRCRGGEMTRMIPRGHCMLTEPGATGEIRLVNQLFGLFARSNSYSRFIAPGSSYCNRADLPASYKKCSPVSEASLP